MSFPILLVLLHVADAAYWRWCWCVLLLQRQTADQGGAEGVGCHCPPVRRFRGLSGSSSSRGCWCCCGAHSSGRRCTCCPQTSWLGSGESSNTAGATARRFLNRQTTVQVLKLTNGRVYLPMPSSFSDMHYATNSAYKCGRGQYRW